MGIIRILVTLSFWVFIQQHSSIWIDKSLAISSSPLMHQFFYRGILITPQFAFQGTFNTRHACNVSWL